MRKSVDVETPAAPLQPLAAATAAAIGSDGAPDRRAEALPLPTLGDGAEEDDAAASNFGIITSAATKSSEGRKMQAANSAQAYSCSGARNVSRAS